MSFLLIPVVCDILCETAENMNPVIIVNELINFKITLSFFGMLCYNDMNKSVSIEILTLNC